MDTIDILNWLGDAYIKARGKVIIIDMPKEVAGYLINIAPPPRPISSQKLDYFKTLIQKNWETAGMNPIVLSVDEGFPILDGYLRLTAFFETTNKATLPVNLIFRQVSPDIGI